jgi:hypothetical protein
MGWTEFNHGWAFGKAKPSGQLTLQGIKEAPASREAVIRIIQEMREIMAKCS